MEIIDISRGIKSAPLYPGAGEPKLIRLTDRAMGDAYTLSQLTAEVHTGTHADAISHFTDMPIHIDQMVLEHYVGMCLVIEPEEGKTIDEVIEEKVPEGCQRVLLRGKGEVYLTPNTGNLLKDKGVMLIGTDAWSVGPLDDEVAVHQGILMNGIAILENLELRHVRPGEYFLSAAPIKLEGSDGAFVRAILIEGMLI